MSSEVLQRAIRVRDEAQQNLTRREGEIASIEGSVQALLDQAKAKYGVTTVKQLEVLYEEAKADFKTKVENLRKVLDNVGS